MSYAMSGQGPHMSHIMTWEKSKQVGESDYDYDYDQQSAIPHLVELVHQKIMKKRRYITSFFEVFTKARLDVFWGEGGKNQIADESFSISHA